MKRILMATAAIAWLATVMPAAGNTIVVDYFMDAANVWFYGHKDGRLFVYDAETDELDDLGELDTGLAQVIEGWQSSP